MACKTRRRLAIVLAVLWLMQAAFCAGAWAAEFSEEASLEPVSPQVEDTVAEAEDTGVEGLVMDDSALVQPSPSENPDASTPPVEDDAADSESDASGETEGVIELEGVQYAAFEQGLRVVGYVGELSEIVIPAALDGTAVTEIAGAAFAGNAQLHQVEIPETVVFLGEGAFENCVALESVLLAGNATLSARCFAGCTSLKSVAFYGGQVTLMDGALEGVAAFALDGNPECMIIEAEQTVSLCDFAWQNDYELNVGAQIAFEQAQLKLAPGERMAVAGSASPSNLQIQWQSQNEDIATVDAQGVVTGVMSGNTTVIASCVNQPEIQDEIQITVQVPEIERILPAVERLILSVGEKWKLDYTVRPKYAQGSVSMKSSAPECISVDAGGYLEALSEGMATITLSAANGVTAQCEVQVRPLSEAVAILPESAVLGVGQSQKFAVAFQSGTGSSCTFSSSDESVARVDAYGNVQALSEGDAVILVETVNGKQAQARLKVLPAPEEVTLEKYAVQLGVGDQFVLSAKILPQKAGELSWTSEDEAIATVDASGRITAESEGSVRILAAAYNGVTGICEVQVVAAPQSIAFAKTEISIGVGETVRLPDIVSNGSDTRVTCSFTSSNTKYLTVDKTGYVRGVKAGTVDVTAKSYNGATAQCKVIVRNAPSAIKLSLSRTEIGAGETMPLMVTFPSGAFGGCAYVSSDPAVATVDDQGIIHAHHSGITEITVTTFNGKTASAQLRVRRAPSRIALSEPSIVLGVDQKHALQCEMDPYTITTLKYATEDPSIASVSSAGELKGLKAGFTTLTVTTHNGLSASCPVEVRSAPSRVQLSVTSMTLGVGQQSDPLEVILGEAGEMSAASYSFASSNKKYATVDAEGRVTGVKAGSAVITVKTHNGRTATCKVKVVNPPGAVAISPSETRIALGEALQYSVTVSKGSVARLSFSSDAPNVATVDAGGRVTAVGVGTAHITVTTHNGKRAVATLHVCYPPITVRLSPKTVVLGSGMTAQMEARINASSVGTYIYRSEAPDIVSVDANGVVIAREVMQERLVRVTVVTNNGKVDSSLVRVLPAPNRIELSETAISLGVTDRYVIDYRLPAGTCGQMRYRSSNARVATVSSEGEVCAVSPGTAQIEVIAQNGVKASLEVTVIKYGAKHPAQTIGHRGASAYAPDNSMEAFQKANAMGASGIETDLRRTKDGVLILSHNDVVTADNGRQISISKSTLEQIQALNFGGQPLCTLEELLNYLQSTDMMLWLEFKAEGCEKDAVELVHAYGMQSRTLYISKSMDYLDNILACDANARCCWTFSSFKSVASVKNTVVAHGYVGILPQYACVTPELTKAMHDMGFIVAVWTVNSEKSMRDMVNKEVDYIATNYVDVCVDLLGG